MKILNPKHQTLDKPAIQISNVLNILTFEFWYCLGFRGLKLEFASEGSL